jgi:hypothetical protein
VRSYEALRRDRGPASAEAFVVWTEMSGHYARAAASAGESTCESLAPEVRRGYARYRDVWNGFRKAQRALEPPLESCVLHALATHYAYWIGRALHPSRRLAGHPGFVEALEDHGDAARRLGLVSTHDLAVRWEMLHESVAGMRTSLEQARLDPSSAALLARAGRYRLEMAVERFAAGRIFAAESMAGIAIDRLYEARSAGASRKTLRSVLSRVPGLADPLPSAGPRAAYAKTFVELVRMKIGERIARQARTGSGPVIRIPGDKAAIEGRGFQERIVVRKRAGRLSLEGHLLEELNLLVRQLAGADVIDEHAELAELGSVLFYGLLRAALAGHYPTVERQWAARHDESPVRSGRAVLADPVVRSVLRREERLDGLRGQLSVVDTPEIWADLGHLHVQRARRTGICSPESKPAWKAASSAFAQAWRRSHPGHSMRRSDRWKRLQRAVDALAHPQSPACAERAGDTPAKSQ